MTRYNLLFATVICAFVAGCTAPLPQSAADPDDKTYVTGSRLPAKDRDSSSSVKSGEVPSKGSSM